MTKKCSRCGTVIGGVEWSQLHLVGYQDDGDGGWLELRNCTCTSTLSVRATSPLVRSLASAASPSGCTKVAASN